MKDTIGFRGRREVPPRASVRQLIGVVNDPVDAATSENRFLDDDLVVGPFIDASANPRVFALIVLADDQKIDLLRFSVGQRRADARQQPDGPQVDVLP